MALLTTCTGCGGFAFLPSGKPIEHHISIESTQISKGLYESLGKALRLEVLFTGPTKAHKQEIEAIFQALGSAVTNLDRIHAMIDVKGFQIYEIRPGENIADQMHLPTTVRHAFFALKSDAGVLHLKRRSINPFTPSNLIIRLVGQELYVSQADYKD